MRVIKCLNPLCNRISTDEGKNWAKDIICYYTDIDYDVCKYCKDEDDLIQRRNPMMTIIKFVACIYIMLLVFPQWLVKHKLPLYFTSRSQ